MYKGTYEDIKKGAGMKEIRERKCMQILKEREREIVKKYFVNDDTREKKGNNKNLRVHHCFASVSK